MVMKIYDEVTVCQRRLELSETEETKLEKYCFLEVRINLWYWLRRDFAVFMCASQLKSLDS